MDHREGTWYGCKETHDTAAKPLYASLDMYSISSMSYSD